MEGLNYWAAIEAAKHANYEVELPIEAISTKLPFLLQQQSKIEQQVSMFITKMANAINGSTFYFSATQATYAGETNNQVSEVFWKFCKQCKQEALPQELITLTDLETYKRWQAATTANELMLTITDEDPQSRLFQEVGLATRRVLYDAATFQFSKNSNTYLMDMDWVNKLALQVMQDTESERRIELLDRYINHPRVLGQHIYP